MILIASARRPKRSLRLAVAATLWFALVTHIGCAAAPRGVDSDLWERLAPFIRLNLTDAQRGDLRKELYAVPNWEDRLAVAMADLAKRGQYDGKMNKVVRETGALNEKGRTQGLSPEETERVNVLIQEMFEERTKTMDATSSRTDLHYIVEALVGVRDERVVRLIAPVLADRSAPLGNLEEHISAPQEIAANGLRNLRYHGMDLPKIYSPDEWRNWWKENRHRYEPIPPVLAAFEASEGGGKATPPPATPVPVTLAPPKPTPSRSPVATVTPAAASPTPRSSRGWMFAGGVALFVVIALAAMQRSQH